jgi:hypothetical protein
MSEDKGLGPVGKLPFPEDVDSSFVIATSKQDRVEEMEQELLQQIQAFQRARNEFVELRNQAWTELKERLAELHPEMEKKIFSSCHLKIIEELGVRKGIELFMPSTCPLCRGDIENDKRMAAQGIRPNKVNINLVEKGSDDKEGAASGDVFDMLERQLMEKYKRRAEEQESQPSEPDDKSDLADDEGWEDTIPDGL